MNPYALESATTFWKRMLLELQDGSNEVSFGCFKAYEVFQIG